MRYIDRYFYKPSLSQKLLALALFPLSVLYCLAASLRRKIAPTKDFHIPIISVGNLIAGGSGKTPFILEITKDYSNIAIISRGYKRQSKGLLIVSKQGKICSTQAQAGDEAYMLAQMAKNATIIVSKQRDLAIKKAKELGCKVVFLDDGFRFQYKKLNILLKPKLEPYFKLCIPSGLYRENPRLYKTADILALEGQEYQREVQVIAPTQRMLLITAIANPSRLQEYLPDVVGKITFSDHATFDIDYLCKAAKAHQATSLLVTQKDAVKLQNCPLPLSILKLNLQIAPHIKEKIHAYIQAHSPHKS
ncbi:tetraacyldisaccharide 4'-kinase [Helicobacter sp. 12S02634-8]|uniref:tetraacyldisaccharide 4'-kinase n=1 Tax=Helicobacter sp. 12S02634-8 TaxID=1476199 RepID=UPI000BA53ABF|nr:tetraacyldisaccharide 4'-kinase [Helicobacter sp. 12S02634-8]PAF46551.1 tetraacyldisaccharide 4'-kinase [Helicobacter sp. 12S02634-8]